MKRTLALATVILALSASSATAQPKTRPQDNLYIELLGNGFLYSINYERFLGARTTLRVGGMFLTGEGTAMNGNRLRAGLVLVPVMLNRLLGRGNHHLEVGAGPLLIYLTAQLNDWKTSQGFGVRATARIGYVYLRPTGGWNFRIAYTPLITDTVSHSAGIAVGYAF